MIEKYSRELRQRREPPIKDIFVLLRVVGVIRGNGFWLRLNASRLRVNIDVSRSQVCSRVALARVHFLRVSPCRAHASRSSCFALPGSRFAPARTRAQAARLHTRLTGSPNLRIAL